MSFKERLRDWTDWDVAAHAVGMVLGVFPAESEMSDFKAVFWSRNELGTKLYNVLDQLMVVGFLERKDDDEDEGAKYRWKLTESGDRVRAEA